MNTLPAGYKLSEKAKKWVNSYEAYIKYGWTEEQMIQEGMIELIQPKKTVADAFELYKGVWPGEGGHKFIGVSRNGTIIPAHEYSIIGKEQDNTYVICTRKQFEEYGRNGGILPSNSVCEAREQLLKATQIFRSGNEFHQHLEKLMTILIDEKGKDRPAPQETEAPVQPVQPVQPVKPDEPDEATKKLANENLIRQQEIGLKRSKINWLIKTNAELTQCNADLVSTNENIITRNRALNNQNHQLKLQQSSLEKALNKAISDYDAAHIEHKQTIAELISDKEVDRNEINIHKEMVKTQGEIILRLNTSNEKAIEESNHLRLNLRDLHLSDSEKTMRIREQAIELRDQALEIRELKIEIREQVIEIREMGETVSSQANELDQLHSMYSEQAASMDELSQVKLNLEKTIQNLTTLTEAKEPKNDD